MGFLDFFKENKIEDKKLIIFVFSLVGVAKIDGEFSDTELEYIRSFFSKYKISESHVDKIIEKALKKYSGKEGNQNFVEDLEELSKKDKLELFSEMVSVSTSDGEIKKEEVNLIKNMGVALGIEQTSVFENFIKLFNSISDTTKREGAFKEFYDNGNLKFEGTFANGELEGLCKQYYENGNLHFEGTYVNGKSEGLYKQYFENGNLDFEGYYVNDELNGSYKDFYENGDLQKIANFVDGKLNGPYEEYHSSSSLNDSGQIALKGTRKNDKLHGYVIQYWRNGNILFEINYKNGLWDGLCIEYDPNEKNKIIKKAMYKDGIELE